MIVSLCTTYWEYSPSGEGLRGFVYGRIPEEVKHSTPMDDGVIFELWDDMRFLTVTVDVFTAQDGEMILGKMDAIVDLNKLDAGDNDAWKVLFKRLDGKKKQEKAVKKIETPEREDDGEENGEELTEEKIKKITEALDEIDFWGIEKEMHGGSNHHDKSYAIALFLLKQGISTISTGNFVKTYNQTHATKDGVTHSEEDVINQVESAVKTMKKPAKERKVPAILDDELRREISNVVHEITGTFYWFDPLNGVMLDESKFHIMGIDKDGNPKRKFLFDATSFEIQECIKLEEIYKFRYVLDRQKQMGTINEIVQKIEGRFHTTQLTNSYLSQFLYKHKDTMISKGEISEWHEKIWVDKDSVIHVDLSSDDPENVKDILSTISKIYKITTHQESFLHSFAYHIMSPFSIDFRRRGKKFPYRMLFGMTHGAKTSGERFWVIKGFNQDGEGRRRSERKIQKL
jgi:hypothetical protein